jgi:hypothetical protein
MRRTPGRSPNSQTASPNRRRRALRRLAYGATALVALCGLTAALATYKRHHDAMHDLSAVGNGIPAVVQIHDPDCGLCQQLRSNLIKAADDVPAKTLQVLIADVSTAAGANFAFRHDSPHVTLLFFDSEGRLVERLQGVKDPEEILGGIQRLTGWRGSAS